MSSKTIHPDPLKQYGLSDLWPDSIQLNPAVMKTHQIGLTTSWNKIHISEEHKNKIKTNTNQFYFIVWMKMWKMQADYFLPLQDIPPLILLNT